ncbi:hypothetical protein GGX14DRAFT_54659 [Mycena pura]|uniref:Uncharacterized protein n=1 Tax=Mycena pura TaxID=153505 RepID=A0AAD6VP32_9AGAR|nr:hypothetical protein GGX14DRAFT_54659 [Mycena pura]
MWVRLYNDRPEVIIGSATPQVTKWALNTIPSLDFTVNFGGSFQKNLEHFVVQFAQGNIPKLDEEDVCNYLCCLNSFFRPVDPKILSQRNKRYFKVFLMTQLLKGLQSATIDVTLVTRLFKTTSGLLNMGVSESKSYSARQVRYLIKEISNFCSALPQEEGWFDLVVSAATFARARNTGFNYEGQRLDDRKTPWCAVDICSIGTCMGKQMCLSPRGVGRCNIYSSRWSFGIIGMESTGHPVPSTI